jgi:hypothetical protein
VVVLEDREHTVRRHAPAGRLEAESALHVVPAVVPSSGAGGLEVDLLALVLSDVPDEQVACLPVEGEPPRIAQPVGPDLGTGSGHSHEGVAGRNGVGQGAVHVEPQDLAQERAQILSVLVRIPTAAAVTRSDVEVAVRAELELPAVVVVVDRMRDGQEDHARSRVRLVGIGRGDVVAREHVVAVQVRVIDVEQPVRLVGGVERGAQQPFLAEGLEVHQRADREERVLQELRAVVHQDPSGLQREEEAAAAVSRVRDPDGIVQVAAGHEGLEHDRLCAHDGGRPHEQGQAHQDRAGSVHRVASRREFSVAGTRAASRS